ncbi:uncharacterized protein K444DRAFT_131685 [Hyaloscypha bicolor E]|uniref:Zn(2)-C6 fungal-type domain-containing protein n=1 Tax=Hyaloscypha bicolor E TaxID=1095630 RepID=A0A2J6SSY7_9HELO|nr:uncharacterized protein K444DRAFT_131685 [Hyaloscypha bicolor E]PMD53896.1 hypothetical protein K444DRAFT_131685 [Hyaloscypha bicolor E]
MWSSTSYNSRGIGSVGGSSGDGGNGGNGGRDDGGPPKKLTKVSRACDRCHKDHQPCKKSDPSNPRSSCLRCNGRRLPCSYDRRSLRRGPTNRNNVLLDLLQQQMNNVMGALALAPTPTLAPAPAPAAFPSIAPASSSSQGAGTLQLPQTQSLVDSRLASDSASRPPRLPSMSLSSAAAPNPEMAHHPQYSDHGLVTGSPFVAPVLPQSWATDPFTTPTATTGMAPIATPLPAATPMPSTVPASTSSVTPSATLATTLSAISQRTPSLQLPPLNIFRDMYYYSRQPQIWQHYEQQAQRMSAQELDEILQALATLVRNVQNVRNAGSGNAGSDGGTRGAGQ